MHAACSFIGNVYHTYLPHLPCLSYIPILHYLLPLYLSIKRPVAIKAAFHHPAESGISHPVYSVCIAFVFYFNRKQSATSVIFY